MPKMKKLLFFWSKLISTFWFVPVFIILIAACLALAFVFLDSKFTLPKEGIGRYLFIGSVDSARSILSTISGAMIGVAGTVFSITLVALTLASSQFGSRLIKNFMYNRLNQIVLGTYISTFIYCLLVLNAIKENYPVEFIPSLSIMFALFAAVANIILLIVFIHHIAVSIQADKVISDISESLSRNIKTLFPEKMGDEIDEEKDREEDSIKLAFRKKQSFSALRSGYLQYIDDDSFIHLASELDILIELYFRPGDYLVKGVETGMIFTNDILDEDKIRRLQTQFITGKTRTPEQDAEHAIHQMVEIAARALSPGVNDPYTAITCIDNLTSTMSYLSVVKFPSRYRYDEEGNLRVIADRTTFEGMLDAAFNQIRQFAEGSPAVVIRLMESLITINKFAKRQNHKNAIQKHARMVLNMAKKTFSESNDFKDLQERSQLILDTKE